MKIKNLIAVAALLLGSTNASAQRYAGDVFPAGNFVYQVITPMPGEGLDGEVALVGIRDGKNPIVDGVLAIPGHMEEEVFGDSYQFNVIQLGTTAAIAGKGPFANPLQTRLDAKGVSQGDFANKADAKSVTFPAPIAEIPANCFNGYTNVTSITFEEGSELTTLNNGSFATTQITTFDFSNCKNLASLPNAVFVEAAPATNTYIKTITLPESSKLLKNIGTAFQRLTELTAINNLDKSSITSVVANAFDGCKKLTKIELPGTVQTIAANAFANCGVSDLTINVDALATAGDATTQLYGTTAADLATLTKLTLKGNLGGVITTNAFKGHTALATLDLSGLNFASLGQIATSAFEGCTAIKSVTIGDINDKAKTGATIDADAFKGCTALTTVTIGDINSASAIGAAAFGNKLKTVTIGTVKAGDLSILAGAFVWDNVKEASLNLASASGKFLSCDDPTTKKIIAANAFDMSAIVGETDWVATDYPVVNIGEIKSKGGVFTAGAINDKTVRLITFTGAIAQNGLDAKIITATNTTAVLEFQGTIATGGIANGALASLTPVMEITFKASLAEKAIATGALTGLVAASHIYLSYTADDNTVNPFAKDAIESTDVTPRTILLSVTDATLEKNFKGLKGLTTGQKFDVYDVKFYVAPTPDDDSFIVYQNSNDKGVAWARINFSSDQLSKTLAGGTKDLKIQRVQTIDGAKVKLTLYATYTDEDDALNASTIYMVPLKVKDGFYHIGKTDAEVIIAKAEKKDADFTVTDVKVPVLTTGYVAGNESLWTGLTNTELHIAANDMTNQQLVDKTASDGGTPVDIYRGTASIAEDLYIMSDPAKYKGFRIDKTTIEKKTDGTGAHINKGWYYMLLKKYTGGAAAARIVWMDDAEATAIYGVKEIKRVEDGAIYTLQGVRVKSVNKGQIYIQNGKKFIAK